MQEQVEWAFEDRRRYLVRHDLTPSTADFRSPVPLPSGNSRPARRHQITGPNHKIVVLRIHRGKPGPAGSVGRRDTGVLGHSTHRRHASRQLPRGRASLGRRPTTGRDSGSGEPRRRVLRGRSPRPDRALRPGRADRGHPPPGHRAARRRARARPLRAVRAEPRAGAHRAHLAAQLHRDLRRAAPHDAVQGEVAPRVPAARSRYRSACSTTRC